MNKEKLVKYFLVAFVVVFALVILNPAKTSYNSVETNYLASVKHDAEVLGDKKLAATKSSTLLAYGMDVCNVLNTEGKTGNDAVSYLSKKSFSSENTEQQNINIIQVIITNAVRHLCSDHIALLD